MHHASTLLQHPRLLIMKIYQMTQTAMDRLMTRLLSYIDGLCSCLMMLFCRVQFQMMEKRSSANVPLPQDDPDLLKIRAIKIRGCICENKCVSTFSGNFVPTHPKHETNVKGRKRLVHYGIACRQLQRNDNRGKEKNSFQTNFHVFWGKGLQKLVPACV